MSIQICGNGQPPLVQGPEMLVHKDSRISFTYIFKIFSSRHVSSKWDISNIADHMLVSGQNI